MRLIELAGRVSDLGPSELRSEFTRYSYIEITEGLGRKIHLTKVWANPNIKSQLAIGSDAVFYFDRAWVAGEGTVKHLWGVKSPKSTCFDSTRFGMVVGLRNIASGALLSLLLVGIPIVLVGTIQCLGSFGRVTRRRETFVGLNWIVLDCVAASEVIKI